MKVGLLLGSFDPIHIGHIAMATECLNQGLVDLVLFTPTVQNVSKARKATHFIDRCDMIAFALEGMNNCRLCALDYLSVYPYYSSTVLKIIKRVYNCSDLYLIMGSDVVEDVPNWNESKWILDNFKIIEVYRDKYQSSVKVDSRVFININISSTYIRNLIKDNKETLPFLTKKVKDYINNNNFYKQ